MRRLMWSVLLVVSLAMPILPAAAQTTTVTTSTAADARGVLSFVERFLNRLSGFSWNPEPPTSTLISSSTVDAVARRVPIVAQVKSFFDKADEWCERYLGIDLYELMRRLLGVAIVVGRFVLGLAGQVLAWLEQIFKVL